MGKERIFEMQEKELTVKVKLEIDDKDFQEKVDYINTLLRRIQHAVEEIPKLIKITQQD